MAENLTTGPRSDAVGRGLWIATGVSVVLVVLGAVSLTISGYRSDEGPLTAVEVNMPWAVFFAGLVGVVMCGLLLARQRSGRAVGRTALWVVGVLTVLVLVTGVVWTAAG